MEKKSRFRASQSSLHLLDSSLSQAKMPSKMSHQKEIESSILVKSDQIQNLHLNSHFRSGQQYSKTPWWWWWDLEHPSWCSVLVWKRPFRNFTSKLKDMGVKNLSLPKLPKNPFLVFSFRMWFQNSSRCKEKRSAIREWETALQKLYPL